ncbi:MAG: DUF1549 domain-containing protein, partial [Winogradskyella sp.]|nr:DUF1549 domain-containing protein [Winogradskyella sp.]
MYQLIQLILIQERFKRFPYTRIVRFIWAVIGFFFLNYSCTSSLTTEVELAYGSLPDYIDYNFHIKPILSDRCYTCHGPDAQTRKAGLRLDIESEAFKKLESGNHAFFQGSIRKSESMYRLLSKDPEVMMPPPDSELVVTDKEIAMIAKWIEQGSDWKEHWSYLALNKPKVPELKNDWVRHNSVDNFIQMGLKEQGMVPTERADKEHLIKRVTMDLTGLPPELEEVDYFLNDDSENAYEKLVDRLLQSDAYAERMAQEWMDVARYSDSHGVSFDGYRTSWPYRDWLIEAFQNNMPYNDFITHQIAGDLVPDANDQSIIATSFLRMNPLEASGGSIPEEFRLEYVNERAGLAGTALLGLTVECAKCHDHKYDAISQKEFYQISAFFNNTEEFGLAPVDSDRPPTLMLLSDDEKSKIERFVKTLDTDTEKLNIVKNEMAFNYEKPLPANIDVQPIGYYHFDVIKDYKKEIKPRKPK